MADIKDPITLSTRIQSKRITYAQAIDATSTFTPLEGEIILVRIDTTTNDGTQAAKPTYIMKVGDGTTTISNLKWFHAPASDVYAWAKKSSLDLADIPSIPLNKLDTALQTLINGKVDKTAYDTKIATIEGNITTINQKLAGLPNNLDDYVTESDFNELSGTVGGHTTDIGNLQTAVGTLNGADTVTGSVAKTVKDAVAVETQRATGIEQDLRTDLTNLTNKLNGEATVDGSLAKVLKQAKDYTDTEISDFNTETITPLTTRVKNLEDNKAGYATTGYVDGEIDKVEQVVANKLDKTTYESYISGKSLSDEQLKNYADSAASGAITTLRGGYTGSLKELDEAYKAADSAIDGRIDSLESALNNVSNVMDFVGVREVTISEGVITVTPNSGETFNKGDVVVNRTGKEFVYDGTKWCEFGDTSALSTSVSNLQSDVSDIEAQLEGISGKVTDYVTNQINNVNSTAEGLDTRIKAIENAPYASQDYVNQAKTNAINTVVGTSSDTKDSSTVVGAKKYADAAVTTLKNGDVKTNSDNISTLSGRVDALDTFKNTTVPATYLSKNDFASEKSTLQSAINGKVAQSDYDKDKATFALKAEVEEDFGEINQALNKAEGTLSDLEVTLTGYDKTNTVQKAISAVDTKAGNAASAASTADGKAAAAQTTANSAIAALGTYTADKAVETGINNNAAAIGIIQTNYLQNDNGKLKINGVEIIFDCGTL